LQAYIQQQQAAYEVFLKCCVQQLGKQGIVFSVCVLQGAAAGEHYLLHAGQQLDASKTLADYSIQHQDTCELLLRLRCVCCTLQPCTPDIRSLL
jgi:hypothetical protein